jgi:hypothetical protein
MSDLLAEIMAAERKRSDALCSRNMAHLDACLDATYVYVHGSGQLERRAEYLASQITRTANFTSFAYEDAEVMDHGSWAVLTGIMTMNYTLNGAAQSRRYRFGSSWRREVGDWLLCSWQNTAIAG